MAAPLKTCKTHGVQYKWRCPKCRRRSRSGGGRRQNWAAASAVAELDRRQVWQDEQREQALEAEAQGLVAEIERLATRNPVALAELCQAEDDDVRVIARLVTAVRAGQPYARPPFWFLSRAVDDARKVKACLTKAAVQ